MTDPILSVEDLRVSYAGRRGRHVDALRGVSLRLDPGEIVAVVGESGSGKSTLAHAVLGLLPAEGHVTGGAIRVGGEDVAGWDERRLRTIRGSRIGLVPQDPMISLNPVLPVGEQVGETIALHTGLGRRAVRARVRALLEEVGIPEPAVRAAQYPHQLSGGMRQRVLLANAWACEPAIVIADEPTSALDVTVQKQVLDKLEGLVRDRGTAALLITHDLAVALERADRIVVMRDGRVVETGTGPDLQESPRAEYTRQLLAAAPSLATGRLAPSARAVEAVVSAASGPPTAPRQDPAARRQGPPAPAPGPLLSGEGLRKVYRTARGEFAAVDDVDLSVRRGATLALVGESGSGKSTTARLLARLAEPTAGRVLFDGRELTGARRAELRAWRRHVQLVYQSPYSSLDPRLTVERIVSEPLRAFRVGDRRSRAAAVRELVDQVLLPASVLDRHPSALSGGQRQRVAIARALALRPEVLVLDEPVSALDASVQAQILQLLVDLRAEHALTYLFITHDLAVVRELADDVAVMRAGRIVETGSVDRVFGSPGHPYTRQLLESIPRPRSAAATPPR